MTFEAIAEGAARVAALEAGDVQLVLLFSTQPVIVEKGFVSLEDTESVVSAENVIPVVNTAIVDAYGRDFVDLINSVSALITTDVLLELVGKVELANENPDDVARDWLTENGFLGS